MNCVRAVRIHNRRTDLILTTLQQKKKIYTICIVLVHRMFYEDPTPPAYIIYEDAIWRQTFATSDRSIAVWTLGFGTVNYAHYACGQVKHTQ